MSGLPQNYVRRVVLAVLATMVVLLECNRRFPLPLHAPSARQAGEWRTAPSLACR